jgi:hypothetical protein
MGRLARFEDFRFIGARDTMTVYDCDDEDQLKTLRRRAAKDDLARRDLLQSFAPDTPAEAANRGFRPVKTPAPTTPLR